ncbi:MAG: hypothetical protein HC911_16350 [Chloroflexaceae bacterium]|nr:hypothetical protein [Chloroflexaceae bacterium]
MKTHRVSARVSEELHQLVQHFGPQGCGVRAAIILSAMQLGFDLAPYQAEVRALLSEPLREPVAAAILRVYLKPYAG